MNKNSVLINKIFNKILKRKEISACVLMGNLITTIFFIRNFLGKSDLFVRFFRAPIIHSFNRVYYLLRKNTFDSTYFMGKHVLKFPTDLWSYQEIIFECKPDVIVETGAFLGGSTYYYSKLLELIGNGRVISVDNVIDHADPDLADLSNVTLIKGDSIKFETLEKIKSLIKKHESVMVILDSDHATAHVYQEMKLFSTLVTENQYLIVEDGLIDNVYPIFCKNGPLAAIKMFLKETKEFKIDFYRNRFLLSQNPYGYLLKTGQEGGEKLPLEKQEDCYRPLRLWLPGTKIPSDMKWLNKLNQNKKGNEE